MKKPLRFITLAAMFAAIYFVLTIAISPISYGPIQFRLSEAMIIFCAFYPEAAFGLTIGCLLANIFSPFGIFDVIFGTTASLLACVFAYIFRKVKIKGFPWLSPLGAVVFNAFLVPVAFWLASASYETYLFDAFTVGVGEFISVYPLGFLLWLLLDKTLFAHQRKKTQMPENK